MSIQQRQGIAPTWMLHQLEALESDCDGLERRWRQVQGQRKGEEHRLIQRLRSEHESQLQELGRLRETIKESKEEKPSPPSLEPLEQEAAELRREIEELQRRKHAEEAHAEEQRLALKVEIGSLQEQLQQTLSQKSVMEDVVEGLKSSHSATADSSREKIDSLSKEAEDLRQRATVVLSALPDAQDSEACGLQHKQRQVQELRREQAQLQKEQEIAMDLDFFTRVLHGYKDVFRLAFLKLNASNWFSPVRPGIVGAFMKNGFFYPAALVQFWPHAEVLGDGQYLGDVTTRDIPLYVHQKKLPDGVKRFDTAACKILLSPNFDGVTCPVGFAALAVMCHRFFGVEERGKAKKVIANLLPGLEGCLPKTFWPLKLDQLRRFLDQDQPFTMVFDPEKAQNLTPDVRRCLPLKSLDCWNPRNEAADQEFEAAKVEASVLERKIRSLGALPSDR
eukprot:g24451.t1